MMIDYVPLRHLDSAAASLFGMKRGTRAFNTATWWGGRHERDFLEFVQGYDQNNMFITMANDRAAHFMEWISLFRADPDAHCTPEETQMVSLLSPHLMQALALNRVMHLERIAPASRLVRGAAIGDLLGVLCHADPSFEAMLREEWNDWPGRALPRELLQHFLHGHAHFLGRTLVATQRVEHGLLFLKTRPRCRADSLTPREHTVAKLMARGDTHKQIAQMLSRSPATVRNQIRTIYEKLEVGNVAGLIEELRLAE
jgi:DNA-binding CsgD family transcriptional regulator